MQHSYSITRIIPCSSPEARSLLPKFSSKVQAGFPSPAEDHMDQRLDIFELLIRNPAATFFVEVAGLSMIDAGILESDILVVDRSLEERSGDIVIASVDGHKTVKRYIKDGDQVTLAAENSDFPDITEADVGEAELWGVVSSKVTLYR